MALRHPITAAADAYEGLVFCLSALSNYYPNRYEDELSGKYAWTVERKSDGRGGTMLRSRITIVQLQGRDNAKSWNFVDNTQYGLLSQIPTYAPTANFAIANTRDLLRLAIYFAKACVAHYPGQGIPVVYESIDPTTGKPIQISSSLPFVNWTESQLANGRPYCALDTNLPLIAGHDGLSSWAALNLTSLPTPAPAVLAAFTAVT
jgi:hypothetical protein